MSILVVNWNGREMLRGLLKSIEKTRGALNVRTAVVDNASTDGSVEMMEKEFPATVVVRNAENLGFGRANNQAAKLAGDAPLLFMLNNDTRLHEGALQSLVGFMNEHAEVVAVGPKLVGEDGEAQETGRNLPTFSALLTSIQFLRWTGTSKRAYERYRRVDFDVDKPGPIDQLAAAALMVRAADFNAIGGFDEGYVFGVEDVDFCRRLRQRGVIYYLPDAVVDHMGRISSRANGGFVNRGYECGWARYLGKYHGRGTAILYKTLVTLDLPIRLIVHGTRCLGQWGNLEKRHRHGRRIEVTVDFMLRGLWAFWRA